MKKIWLGFAWLALVSIGCNLFSTGAENVASPQVEETAAPDITSGAWDPTATSDSTSVDISPTSEPAFANALPEAGVLVLNEIGFLPPPGGHPFVELKNGGRTAISLAGIRLENEAGQVLELPPKPDSLAPGEVLLLRFDGTEGVSGNTISILVSGFIHSTVGRLSLQDGAGMELDWVAWGLGQSGSVRMGIGGVLPEPQPGFTIARSPYSFITSPQEWGYTSPRAASPGAPNPQTPVSILLPLSGAVVPAGQVQLSWYLARGAASYHIQVASDPDFTQIAFEERIMKPPITPQALPAGTYYWRVAAIGLDGQEADYSVPSVLTIQGTQSAWQDLFSPPRVAFAASGTVLNVPLLEQHKDTEMILLEHPEDEGPHAWHVAHPGLDVDDPADNANCALASIAMVNNYFGGDLSQDRIGFEVFKDRGDGPEEDLNYDDGLFDAQILQALEFALGKPAAIKSDPAIDNDPAGAYNQMWADVKAQIDQGKPVVGSYVHSGGGHAFVFVGYQEKPEGNFFIINDPWGGIQYTVSAIGAQALDYTDQGRFDTYFILPDSPQPTMNEPEIAIDSDFDDVIDFDEIQRFKTNPGEPDSDRDEIDDYTEIWTTGFDPNWGYAVNGNYTGRDTDGDELANELDRDSDDGGCWDGVEDHNKDGEFQEDDETYNYDWTDDLCFTVDGDWIFSDSWGNTTLKILGNFLVNEEQEIEGAGELSFNHKGPCTTSSQTGPLEFGGEVTEEKILLQIIDNAEDDEVDTQVSEDLPAGCTLGEVLGESFAASFGPAAAMPQVIELDMPEANAESSVTLDTPSALADREPGSLTIRVERLEPES